MALPRVMNVTDNIVVMDLSLEHAFVVVDSDLPTPGLVLSTNCILT